MIHAFKTKGAGNISLLPIFLFILVTACILCSRQQWKENPYAQSDPAGYYMYLPAAFIYHDLGRMDFAAIKGIKDDFVYEQKATGRRMDKYPVGLAISEMPFFFLAHAWCYITQNYPMDGYSTPYQVMGVIANIIWSLLGLLALRRLLQLRYSEATVAITILCIGLGTNLYLYTNYILGMSHSFSFFLFACVLYLTDKWHRTFMWRHMLLLGLALGLVLMTRPANIIVALLPMFWNVYSISSLKRKVITVKKHVKSIIAALVVILLLSSVQAAYWQYTTGHLILFSYQGEYFNFLHPHIWQGLFSYRKGWFVYTPMAFLGMLGFYVLWKKQKEIAPVLTLFFILMVYIVFSWKMWWYGGGFGSRPMIETLAVLSLSLAALIEAILQFRRRVYKILCFIPIAFFIVLNLFQSYQYSVAIINSDRMTRAYYWRVFGKTKVNFEELEKYQLQGKDYWGPMEEITHP